VSGNIHPRVVVFSSLFPNASRPLAGIFIRERMFRVGRHLPLVVVAPVPWFPFQSLIRRFKPHYRCHESRYEVQDSIEIYYPRFLSIPGLLKSFDGLSMGLCAFFAMRRLKRRFRYDLIDSHFAYPDGYAATLLGKWLRVPVTVTLRGTEIPYSRSFLKKRLILKTLERAIRVFSVSESLKQHAVSLGANESKIEIVNNGVDTKIFYPISKEEARKRLGIPADAKVLISIGALVERKGFHRVINLLPSLLTHFPALRYLVVGGASPEGDWSKRLRKQAKRLGLNDVVVFTGAIPPEELNLPLSAADVFVLATENEGWANVFLEAMACGLPIVSTQVGGNKEVISDESLGRLVPLNDPDVMKQALIEALDTSWDNERILKYAKSRSWNKQVKLILKAFREVTALHIGIVGPVPPPYGGMANQLIQLSTLLKAEGANVSILQTNTAYKPRLIEKIKGIRAVFRLLPYLFRVWEITGKVDVIHLFANSGWSWQLFSAPVVWIGWLRKTPVVVNYRGGEAKKYLDKSKHRVLPTLNKASTLVVPSGYLKKIFSDFGKEAKIIPNIIDLGRFKSKQRKSFHDSSALHLVVTRNLEPIYDIPTAIKAVDILRSSIPNLTLSIAGSGPQKKELQRLVEQLELEDHVVLTGKLNPEEVVALYRDADIMLNPTTADNMPNSILESLACGVPVVTTNVGGIPYLVEDGKNGLMVNMGDAEGMAKAVERVVTDFMLYENIVKNGLDEAERYAWPVVRDMWLNLYLHLKKVYRDPSNPGTKGYLRTRN